MELNATQFWDRLERSTLISPEQSLLWQKEIEQSIGGARPLHPSKVASELIRTGRITPFQFNALLEPTVPRLRIGPYVLTDTLSDQLGSGWYQAVESIRNTTKWVYSLSSEQLQSDALRSNPPSIELGRMHMRLEAPDLDRWEAILLEPGVLAAISDPLPGEPLSSKIASGPIPLSQSLDWIRSIAMAIARLHSSGLIHGWLTPDAVWITPSGDPVLRRDPIYPACSPYFIDSLHCLAIDAMGRYGMASPELTIPDYQPDASCDLYALGVLWATLLLGRSPWPNSHRLDRAGWRKTHQQVALELPHPLPDGVRRCISHLVAKNRQARFPSMESFLKQVAHLSVEKDLVLGTPAVAAPAAPAPVVPAPKATPNRDTASPEEQRPAVQSKPQREVPKQSPPASIVTAAQQLSLPAKPAPKLEPKLEPISSVPSRASLIQKKKKRKPAWVVPAMGIGALVVLGGLIAVLLQSGGGKVAQVQPEVKIVEVPASSGTSKSSESSTATPPAQSDPLAEFFTVVVDDGASLWAPPHAGIPYSIDMLPPGAEALVFFSKAAWVGSGSFQSIQPWVLEAIPVWKPFIDGVPFAKDERIAQVAIGLFPSLQSGTFEVAFRFNFESPIAMESLLERLPGISASPSPNDPKQGLWSYGAWSMAIDELAIDKTQQTRRLTVGPKKLMESLAEIGGRSVPLRRQMDMLLRSSDSRGDLFVLAAPSFLLGDGQALFNAAPRLQPIARSLWGDDVQAVSYACSAQPSFYSEWRVAISDTTLLMKRAAEFKQALEKSPDHLEQQLVAFPPSPYWGAIALRMPQMVRALVRNSRFGLEEGQIVGNAYLPPESLANLTIGTWMSLQGLSNPAPAVVAQPKTPSKPSSVEELLARPISISFEQESLEMGLAAIAAEFNDSVLKGEAPLEFTINGSAFQKEGITQNQQVRAFNQANIPLRAILTDLVRRANPVTTVQSPTERDQKVVWVLIDDPDSVGGKRIELTTRVWAESNNAMLPKEFIP